MVIGNVCLGVLDSLDTGGHFACSLGRDLLCGFCAFS